ncbi:GH92 family glycosyl hydrolase [Parabacteroides sp. Marseille-P3160]|uniref:GH92 family glycosyl hydrolase n=1 Tax=Parabacteroides sp. Marseille-P3160 TaxID=1917887 RepID=UPI0009BAB557|nr:GH92 family glycosyl hydrolase [Parabacteroides sp. Marseille-P3160]
MKKTWIVLALLFSSYFYTAAEGTDREKDYCRYVNPFIGCADNGHTFPGATIPFGLIQASPETGRSGWRYCSGYNYEDDSIVGFAQTHINGTGCPDLGDILLFPFTGDGTNYKSSFSKETEKAVPGYYAVKLSDSNVDVELTATERTAFHKYTFKGNAPARLLIEPQSGIGDPKILYSEIDTTDHQKLAGHYKARAWVERQVFYSIEFDAPYRILREELVANQEHAKRFILEFDLQKSRTLQVKIALSSVSKEGAAMALKKENSGWDFAKIKDEAYSTWNNLLSKVDVEGTNEQKTNFYTSLYHLYIQPNNIADIDGKYRGVDDKVYTSPSGAYYSTFSLWDTYRAAHPLYTILSPEKVDGFIQSMLSHYKAQGFLPIWTLCGKENYCMIGNHSIPVIADAFLKGFNGFDAEEAYRAVKMSSTQNHRNSDWTTYDKYGYYPFDIITVESVSRTLESAYDDYCIALMAKKLGKDEDYAYFMKRANYYKNLFDPGTKLMRGKDSKGHWRTPFNTFLLSHAGTAGGDYTEGNAWQYTWHVQHDVEGLIRLMGGKEAFATKLDSLFFLESTAKNSGFVSDVTGLIGQYAHGNEPSHHVAYLYMYAGQPSKTQSLIREIFDRFYLPKPDGLCGNDDCGQMSAWYLFSAMGFYPVNPCGGEYIIGAPQTDQVTIHLPGQKQFVVKAKNLSEANKYVSSVELNGHIIKDFRIKHSDIMKGGELVFVMTDKL